MEQARIRFYITVEPRLIGTHETGAMADNQKDG